MNYKLLGRSTLRISVTGFGCMSLGGGDLESARVIHRAIELGINFFDTADLYERGLNEERVGRILEGRREQVVLATKVGNEWRADGSGWDWNPRKGYILRAVEASLRRLRTDRIDLYQLHGGTIDDPIDEAIETFELLRQQGKILFYGISSIRPDVIREYIRRSGVGGGGGSGFVSVMMQYSLADRRPEESCLAALGGAGIGVLARGTVMKGMLAGKKAASYLGHSAAEMAAAAIVVREVVRRVEATGAGRMGIDGEAKGAGMDAEAKGAGRAGIEVEGTGVDAEGTDVGMRGAAQVAIRWVLENPAIASAVVGIRTMEQLEDAVAAGDGGRLGGEEVQLLRTALNQQRYEEHR